MSDLIDKVRNAQIQAGENVVCEHLAKIENQQLLNRITELEAKISALESARYYNHENLMIVEANRQQLEAERNRYKDAIKHAIRLLSFGGDAQIMNYLSKLLDDHE